MVIVLLIAMSTTALAAAEDWSGFTPTKQSSYDYLHVWAIQEAFSNGYCYNDYDPRHYSSVDPKCVCGYIDASGGVDGVFGSGTLNAVKRFQSLEGLTVDGSVGNNTWKKIRETALWYRAYGEGWRWYGIGADEDPLLNFRHEGETGKWQVISPTNQWATFEW